VYSLALNLLSVAHYWVHTEGAKMKAFPKWLVHLLPRRDQSFTQRFVGILFTWGLPLIVLETVTSGVLRSPAQLPFFMALELPATLGGVVFFAAIEHLYFSYVRKRPD